MKDKKGKAENAERAFQRSKIYRLLSFCFFYPNEELRDFLKSDEFSEEMTKALGVAVQGCSVSEAVRNPFPEELKGMKDIDLERIIDEHVRLLTLKSECPPYETEYYRSKTSVFTTEEMADIGGFYRAIGMEFVKDRPDHIATELEFMHLVTIKEAEALFTGEDEKTELCITMERKFLNDHLGRWIDAFSEALESQGGSFYRSIGMLLRHWIDLDCKYHGVTPQKVTDFNIVQSEEDEQMCLGRGV